jgi:C4-dicarboxylate-binding protein DctP
MMVEQDQVAKDIKVSPEMVKLIVAEAGSGS